MLRGRHTRQVGNVAEVLQRGIKKGELRNKCIWLQVRGRRETLANLTLDISSVNTKPEYPCIKRQKY